VLSYLRRYGQDEVLVVLNMSASPQTVRVPVKTATTLVASSASQWTNPGELTIEPFGAYIGEVGRH
jgi:Maltogenic Amylase, C-terminal domain